MVLPIPFGFVGNPGLPATNGTLTLLDLAATQSGAYYVIVSNSVNSVTSAPVSLNVKSVEVYNGIQILSAGTYAYTSPPTLTIRSAYTNGEIFYTLDGSAPTFNAMPYTAPFLLISNATVKAVGYSSDFSQSDLADPAVVTVPQQYSLSVSTPGGGTISVRPNGGTFTNSTLIYASNTVVTLTANPAPGFSLLYWQGVTSMSPTISVTLSQSQEPHHRRLWHHAHLNRYRQWPRPPFAAGRRLSLRHGRAPGSRASIRLCLRCLGQCRRWQHHQPPLFYRDKSHANDLFHIRKRPDGRFSLDRVRPGEGPGKCHPNRKCVLHFCVSHAHCRA